MGLFGKHFNDERVDGNGNFLPEVCRRLKLEIGETAISRVTGLNELRALIKGEPSLNAKMDDQFLLRFLRTKTYKVDRAFSCLRNYYRARRDHPSVYTNLYPSRYKHLFQYNPFILLPRLDPNGNPVVICKTNTYDPTLIEREEGLKAGLLAAELFASDPIAQLRGFVLIIDCEGSGFHQVRANPPHRVKKYLFLIQDSFPLKLKATHVVNESPIVDLVYTLAKPFLAKKFRERIHFHGRDLKSLHKFIPQDMLPEQYGGTYPDIDMQNCVDVLLNHNDMFIENAKYGYVKGGKK